MDDKKTGTGCWVISKAFPDRKYILRDMVLGKKKKTGTGYWVLGVRKYK